MRILIILLLFISIRAYSQSDLENKFRISVGYGLAVVEVTQDDLDGFTATGPFYLKVAYGLYHNLSIGLNGSYAIYKTTRKWPDPITMEIVNRNYNYQSYSLLLRMNYHLNEVDRKKPFDPYIGIGIGYRNLELKEGDNNLSVYRGTGPSVGIESTVGANYFFSRVVAMYMELGLAKSALQFGFTASF